MVARVYQVAREYGVESKRVLTILRDLGEFVRSPSSNLPAPVERRLREQLGPAPNKGAKSDAAVAKPWEDPPRPALERLNKSSAQRTDSRLSLTPPMPQRNIRYEWHKGAPPSAFTKYILDTCVLVRRTQDDVDHLDRADRYFVREMREANRIAEWWAPVLIFGWSYADVLLWMHTTVTADQAVQLKQAGVAPEEIGWHWEDGTRGDLQWRVLCGHMTVAQVILEVVARRVRDN